MIQSLRFPKPFVRACTALALPAALLTSTPTFATAQSPRVATAAAPTDYSGVGTFEATGIVRHQYAPSWSPWTMSPEVIGPPPTGAGIAKTGAPLLMQSAPAPQGQYVAFVQGTGTMSCLTAIPAGTWRLRFLGAQRVKAGVLDNQKLRVTIGSTTIFEEALLAGRFDEYATEPFRMVAGAPTPTVTFTGLATTGDHMALIDRVLLEPVVAWSSTSTWVGGVLPTTNEDVQIPADVAVHLDGTYEVGTLEVVGGLVTKRVDSALTTRWLVVRGSGGSFSVGREGIPFQQNFTLTLKGVDTDPSYTSPNGMANAGTKFLMSMDGGRIDMHGLSKTSWTKLASLSTDGLVATVDTATNWAVGDQIVVAYTGWQGGFVTPDPAPLSQERTIAAFDPVTRQVTFNQAVNVRNHCAAPATNYTVGTRNWTVDERAEVGMLSHNVRVVGTATGSFGGHVMIMACCPNMAPGFGRFSGIELMRMGQQKTLGRYPMHWHMQRDNGRGQYLRDSSVHLTFNRAVTIHGSHNVAVERNVCFDIEGHAMFLEDGVERNNLFDHNLVLGTRRPAPCLQMLPHDTSKQETQNRSPAAFWISNPDNLFIGNVAGDSIGSGYWFALHMAPTGLSSTATWSPSFGPVNATLAKLGQFTDNICHSCRMGLDLNDSVGDHIDFPACNIVQGTPTPSDPTDDNSLGNIMWKPTILPTLSGFTAYGCALGIYTGGGVEYVGAITFLGAKLVDNSVHVQLASADTVRDSLFVHNSGTGVFPGTERSNAYVVYDGPGQVYDSDFVGYDGPTGNSVYGSLFGAARRHPNHLVQGLRFAGGLTPSVVFDDFASEPATSAYSQPFVWGIAIHDLDGSLSRGLFPDTTLVSNHPMMHLTNGASTPDRLLGTNAWLSPFHWGHLQLFYYAGTGMDVLLSGARVPQVSFVRRVHQGWARAAFTTSLEASQMRQLPVIIRQAGSTAPECQYEVQLLPPGSAITLRRVDVVIDDVSTGDVTRLIVSHQSFPNWAPTVYLNDTEQVPPGSLVALAPGAGTGTSYTLTTVTTPGGSTFAAIDLRMVNTGRAHRVTLTW